jgi:YVTN family beta-propeller protein
VKKTLLWASRYGLVIICLISSAMCQQGIVTVPVALNPGSSAVDVSANRVYVIDEGSNGVSVIGGQSNTVTMMKTGTQPSDVAVNAITHIAYVVNNQSNTVTVGYDNGSKRKTISVGLSPVAVAPC